MPILLIVSVVVVVTARAFSLRTEAIDIRFGLDCPTLHFHPAEGLESATNPTWGGGGEGGRQPPQEFTRVVAEKGFSVPLVVVVVVAVVLLLFCSYCCCCCCCCCSCFSLFCNCGNCWCWCCCRSCCYCWTLHVDHRGLNDAGRARSLSKKSRAPQT